MVKKQNAEKPILTKSGIPTSSIDGEPILRRRASISARVGKVSPKRPSKAFRIEKTPKKPNRVKNSKVPGAHLPIDLTVDNRDSAPYSEPSQKQEHRVIEGDASLPADSSFMQSRIVGTTSAKLSYLISQILKYYQQEKILVFYDGENAAYYIAQMLELLHIKHEIYAKSLAAHLKSEYVVRFDQETQDRVLLMDVRNAAYGLNLPSASRIFFVNPLCRPQH